MADSVHPADHAGLRRANLSLIVRTLRAHGAQSRATLARLTKLNKATVSSLVAELEQRRLVRLGNVIGGGIGRPGQLVELHDRGVCGIGLEANVNYVAIAVLDPAGETLLHRRIPTDVAALGARKTAGLLAELATDALRWIAGVAGWASGITIAVPGMVDISTGTVRFAPNLGWRDERLAEYFSAYLGPANVSITVDNDANLSAIAEHISGVAAGASHLLYLTGETGVGGGMIADGRLLRGTKGFAGEVGHISLGANELVCGCGRTGCWETQVGMGALLRAIADPDDPVRDPALDLEQRLAIIVARARQGEPQTLAALQEIGAALGVGTSVLINVLNPTVVVLGGYFAALAQWILEPIQKELTARVVTVGNNGAAPYQVVPSNLGFTAAVRGGAYAALELVMRDPTQAPTLLSERIQLTSPAVFPGARRLE